MKKNDLLFILFICVLFAPFFIFPVVFDEFKRLSMEHAFFMAFFKFGVLSTMGEMLALRMRKGVYNETGFGLLPRAFVWGVLGIGITAAMRVFKNGAPEFTDYLFNLGGRVEAAMSGKFSGLKLLGAFSVSLFMNSIFAPVFMTLHKITDTHVNRTGGTLKGFFTNKIQYSDILQNLNWKVQWRFVFMKTIPFFWIPAHTITFILPAEYQVLFAALLGVALGIILAFAANKN